MCVCEWGVSDSENEIACLHIYTTCTTRTELIYECRCDERLRDKSEASTRLTYPGCRGHRTGTPKDRDEVKRREV